MAKPDLGNRRVCPDCDAKFFDLNKSPAICPKCGFTFDPAGVSRRPVRKKKPAAQEAGVDPDADEDEEESQIDEDDPGDDNSDEDEKELTLDDDSAMIVSDDDDEDGSATPALPEGFTEEGVEDDADILSDDDEEDIDLDGADDLGDED